MSSATPLRIHEARPQHGATRMALRRSATTSRSLSRRAQRTAAVRRQVRARRRPRCRRSVRKPCAVLYLCADTDSGPCCRQHQRRGAVVRLAHQGAAHTGAARGRRGTRARPRHVSLPALAARLLHRPAAEAVLVRWPMRHLCVSARRDAAQQRCRRRSTPKREQRGRGGNTTKHRAAASGVCRAQNEDWQPVGARRREPGQVRVCGA